MLPRVASKISWVGDADARVEAYAAYLGGLQCGSVAIQIDDSDVVNAPQFDMDEHYELRIASEQVLLKANTTWGALHGITPFDS